MNQVFLEYLEEAYEHTTEISRVNFTLYVKPYLATMLNDDELTHEELLLGGILPNATQNYFAENFERCDNCNEWTRREDLHQARYDVNVSVCPQCREDGC